METTVTINIEDYLSESEKKEIATECFKDELRKGLLENTGRMTSYENYERVISNSIFQFLRENIDSVIGCDHMKIIKEKVDEIILKDDYRFDLFRKKNFWEKEDSPAQIIAKQAVESHKEEMTTRIKAALNKAISTIDHDTLYEMYVDAFHSFIQDKMMPNHESPNS